MLLLAQTAIAAQHTSPQAATGTIQIAFTPGDAADQLIINTIRQAHQQILVQAYSFTHLGIADALIKAHRRGVDVILIADKNQDEHIPTSLIHDLAQAGITIVFDSEHSSAHNKVMIIDANSPHPAVITGSYNFTHAAQFTNAENLLIFRDNLMLTQAYHDNWQFHYLHSLPL
ncbi:phospholipase D family protein [Sulfuriferula nivalis]|uniref:phospholipase D n=1 Tax=Sulfuriferula nivalis TaxID=2675298 RepID=A0A809RD34_9PROT|nr:phospholipase D family protein [Sulfuriferula nivalis]BBO99565.1 phospholipase [Sulfuriferula nivalis]